MDRLPGLCYNIYMKYKSIAYEIIIAEQNSNEPFKLGQMRNLGFKKSQGDMIVFLDVDIRFKEFIDFYKVVNKKPMVCWEYIIQVHEDDDYNIKEIEGRRKGVGKGGCIAFTKYQFIKSGGNSNLIIGWGKEDDILKYRLDMDRLMNKDIYHVFHKDKREKWGLGENKKTLGLALDRNVKIANMVRDCKIDKYKDGFEQTIAECNIIKEDNNYKHYLFSDVTVNNNYEYRKLYDEISEFL